MAYQGSCNAVDAAVGDTVYVACDGALLALDAATGATRWEFAGHSATTVAVTGDLVYVEDADGVIYALDIATGQERWRFEVTDPHGTLVVDNGLLAVASWPLEAGKTALIGIDATTGEERSRFEVADPSPIFSSAAANGIVYASSSHSVVAVDAATGRMRWRTETEVFYLHFSGVVISDGIALVGSFTQNGGSYSLSTRSMPRTGKNSGIVTSR